MKQVGVLAVICVVAIGGYYGWSHYSNATEEQAGPARPKARAVNVEVEAATYKDLDILIEAVGSTRAIRSVEITPLATGRVVELGFTAGTAVKKGQVLLRLDDDIQRADVSEAEARLKDAETTLERSVKLKRSNAVSVAAVDSLMAQLEIAKADRDRARRRLRDRVVTAPFDGIVGFSDVEMGTRVEDGDVVTVLDDLSTVEVQFSLPEMLFGKVEIGKRVVADAAAFPDRIFEGEIIQIDSRIDPVSRAFKVRAVVGNKDKILPSGMFVHLSVVLEAERALVVAEESIIVDGTRAYLYVVTTKEGQDRAERRYVTVGRRSFGFAEIVDGVAEGERVIIRGHQRARDGALVKVQGDEKPSKKPAEAAPATGS